jgi:hypothetical protein
MIKYNNIVILVLSTIDPNYVNFKEAIQTTWMQEFRRLGIKCFFYEGANDTNAIQGETIKLKAPDELKGVSEKFTTALKFIFQEYPDTKLVYRTNLSSYIDVYNFIKFLHSFEINENTYAGILGKTNMLKEYLYKYKVFKYLLRYIPFGKKLYFASGSGFFLGSTHCQTIISSQVNLNLVDDVMIAKTIKLAPSDIVSPKRIDVNKKTKEYFTEAIYDKLVENDLLFHFRFKTNNRIMDAELLKKFADKSFRREYLIRPVVKKHFK